MEVVSSERRESQPRERPALQRRAHRSPRASVRELIAESLLERTDPCGLSARARPFEEEVRDLRGSKRSSASARAVLRP